MIDPNATAPSPSPKSKVSKLDAERVIIPRTPRPGAFLAAEFRSHLPIVASLVAILVIGWLGSDKFLTSSNFTIVLGRVGPMGSSPSARPSC